MKYHVRYFALGILTASISGSIAPLQAAGITILVNQGAVSGVRDLAAAYEKSGGRKVIVSPQAGAAMAKLIEAGAPAGLVSSFAELFGDLVKRGHVVPGSFVEFARAGNGVAVKAGAAKPDISTAEAFKQALLQAKMIGHSSNGAGLYNTRLFQKLGIYGQIKDKITIINGRPVAAAVAAGDVEIGIQQTNVIQPMAGTHYLGPLPGELIEYGRFVAGLLTVSKEPDAARAFLAFMGAPEAAPLLRKSAMDGPAK